MTLLTLTWIAFGFAIASCILFAINWLLFQPPRFDRDSSAETTQPVSVLIPARDEALGIADAIHAVLANQNVQLQLLILDDHSTDGTARIVEEIATRNDRVELITGQPLPEGWCGKQFACHQLAAAAKYEHLLFLDADVRISPTAIRHALHGQQSRGADLWSGFPRLLTNSLGEGLLIPMIYLVLLTYLPMFFMRWTRMQSAAAGCGQFFLTTKTAYQKSGGHQSIRSSLHDGVTLPRSYRAAGLRTDLFDARDIATCRMYDGWSESWSGLSKNAHEGIATTRRILPFTALLFLGYIAPTLLLLTHLAVEFEPRTLLIASCAFVASYLPRACIAFRYDRHWLAAILLPLSVLLFLILQWKSLFARRGGATSTWRGREYPTA